MSKGGKPQQQTQTQTTSIDPAARQAYLDNLNAAKQAAAGLGVQEFAGFDPMYQEAERAAYQTSMQPFTPESITQFQNSYETDVINAALGDVERARKMQSLSDASQATAAKAFGGSRQAVQSALTNEAALRNAANLASSMRSQGYQTAAQLAQQARGMNLQGYQNAMNLGLTRQQFAQAQLDALRNLPLQRLAIQQAAMSAQPANLGMTTKGTGTQETTKNIGAGILGGALAGSKLDGSKFGPWGAVAGGILGAF